MKKIARLLPAFSLSLSFIVLFVARAQAMDCGQCTPTSYCSAGCTLCDGIESPDGSCSNVYTTTCGQANSASGCIQDGCAPSFQETSRVLRGTYQDNYYLYCEHFRLEWVTEVDVNQCNTDPAYWTRSYCDRTKDGYKWGAGASSCCNGLPSSLFTCNNQHSC